jgi:acyl-CoA thioesterase
MSTADDLALRSAAAMQAGDEALRHLGIEIDAVSPGRARARMRVAGTMVNGHGMAHGGFVFALADTAFAYACNTEGEPTVARQCEITFLRPARSGDVLLAVAELRARAGRSGIYDVRVTREGGEVVAELRGHSATLAGGPTP